MTQRLKVTLDPALPWLLAGWALGVLLLSGRFLGSWVRVQRLRRRSAEPVPAEWHLVVSRLCRELKLSRTVRLLQSAAVEVPTALGWLRPLILLPACALTGLAPLQLEAILAHELAHIRRGDFLVNLLQSLVEVLLFYHPAVWWLSSRIRAERELCCDDVAAELCGDPLLLARALAELEALREPLTPSPTHLALAANGGSLMHRIRHLIHPALPITSGARATALALLAASLLGAAGVALQNPGKEGTAKPEKTTRIAISDDNRKLDVQMKGEVKLNGEAPEPVVVPGDGSFRIEEKKGGKARTYAANNGKATYTVDGKEVPLDKEGKEWVRGIVAETLKAQSGRKQAHEMKVRVELDRAPGEKEGDRAERRHDHERRIEIHTRRLDDRERELDVRSHDLETRMQDLERRAELGTPEEQVRLRAEADQLKTEGARLKAEGERWKVESERLKNDPELKALIEQAQKEGRRVRMEVMTRHGEEPGSIIIRKEGEPGDKEVHLEEIRIPRIRLRHLDPLHAADPQAEMAELQAELKALQTRLDQLQKQLATTPKPPRPPKAPLAPKSAHPAPPPPPPAPDAPPAPPAPPAEPGH
jgi:beta-lactamase regulating signal transducer with metallopeptidase domain